MPNAPWGRRTASALAAALTERLGYKAAALFFAVALWVVASGEETAEQYVPVRFTPVLDRSVRMVGDAPRVRALVAGPTRQLLKLYRDPPTVRRAFGPQTPNAMTVELHAADVELPSGTDQVAVRDVDPHVLALRFQPAATRSAEAP
jgi:hypothetical protein